MLDQIPGDKSIAVIASYRTGSTALCDYLSKKLKIENLDEVFHIAFPKRAIRFNFRQEWNYKTIIKIMPDQMPKFKVQKTIFPRAFVVGLYRQDVVAQITSYYIAFVTGKWHNNNNKIKDYVVDIDMDDLKKHYKNITAYNGAYQTFRPLFDLEIAYEDIKDQLNDSSYTVYQKPLNYDEITMQVKNIAGNQ